MASLAACLPTLVWWACHRPNRRWWRFTGWWALAVALAVAWWVGALLLLGRVSPVPGLHRVLRGHHAVDLADRGVARDLGTDPVRGAHVHRGLELVTQPVMVLATTLVAAGGLAGLALRSMPARGRLIRDAC